MTLTEDERDVEGVEVTEPAPTDRTAGYGWYAFKLATVVRESIRTGNWREAGMLAWY